MVSDEAVADVLGIGRPRLGDGAAGPARSAPVSPLRLMTAVENGLPLVALDRLARLIAPGDAGFAFRVVPKATLARRRKARAAAPDAKGGLSTGAGMTRLSPDEGARVARLAEIWEFAKEVWGGEAAARDFLFRPHPLLEARRPVDVVLANEFGRRIVDGILGRLRYGSAV